VASDGKSQVDFRGGQDPSAKGGITQVANPGDDDTVTGEELLAADSLVAVDVDTGGLTDTDNPWLVYEVSEQSVPLKLPEQKDRTLPIAAGMLGGAFCIGGLYSFTALSHRSLWLLRALFRLGA
jgi:hypothetical protein